MAGRRSTLKSTPDASVRLLTDVNRLVNEDNPLPVSVISGGGGGGGGTIDGNVGVLDGGDVRINPATEETLDDVKTALTGLQTFVDGLETLITGTNSALAGLAASLTSIGTYTDQLEGFTDGLEGSLTTLAGKDFATEATLADIETELILIESEMDDLETLSTAIRDGDRTLSKRFEWASVGGEFKPLYIGKAMPGSLDADAVWWVTRWTFADQGGGDYKPTSVESAIGIAWDDRVLELP